LTRLNQKSSKLEM